MYTTKLTLYIRIHASEYARKAWYEGGMWRGPNVLPAAAGLSSIAGSPLKTNNEGGSGSNNDNTEGSMGGGGPMLVPRAPVSLSDLFLDIVSKFLIVNRILCLQYA